MIYTLLSLRVSAECFCPNDTADSTGTSFAPCKPSGPSMCCQTNTSHATSDTRMSDEFCIPLDNNNIWRKTCTDPTWKDPACINLYTPGKSMFEILSQTIVAASDLVLIVRRR